VSAELSARAIAQLDDVRAYGYDPADDDHEIQCWIDELNAASQEFHDVGNREFVAKNADRAGPNDPVTVAQQTRYFDLDHCHVEERMLDIGDFALPAPTAVRITALDGSLVETVTLSTLVYLPRIREPHEPIEELWFRPGMLNSAALAPGYIAEVDGKWGFPSLPANLVQACAKQAAIWFSRDIRRYSTTFNLDSNRFEVPRSLSPAIRDVVKHYARRSV
jgi:hypothetical protein